MFGEAYPSAGVQMQTGLYFSIALLSFLISK